MALPNVVYLLIFLRLLATFIKASNGLRSEITSIKTKHGAIYDCVDFYEQPAFKHPLLRNHSFHPKMRPSPLPRSLGVGNFRSLMANKSNLSSLERVGCPVGTVPIRRANKEDHAQATLLSQNLRDFRMHFDNVPLDPGAHLAVVQTKSSSSEFTYYGVGSFITVWKPEVKDHQFSAGLFIIQNGVDVLQVGWMTGGIHCFNTYCPGFVLVRSDLSPDSRFITYSKPGSPIGFKWLVYRDKDTGNWWLAIGDDLTRIGFWPENIFTSLQTHGNYIGCGGETYNDPYYQQGGDPPMGSGRFPLDDPATNAYADHFVTVNDKFQTIDVAVDDTESFSDDVHKYNVLDSKISRPTRRLLYFGGYGG